MAEPNPPIFPNCSVHPDRPGVGRCAICDRSVCELCALTRFGELRCPACAEIGLPWDQRAERGALRAYFETFRGALLSPDRLFRALPATRGISDPFRYDLITQYLGQTLPSVLFALSVQDLPIPTVLGINAHQLGTWLLLTVPLSGLISAIFNLVFAWPIHGALRLMGVGAGEFRRTYAALAYGSSPTALNTTLVLPFFFVPQLWSAVSTIAALRLAHRTSNLKATLALVLPVSLILLACGIGLIFWVRGALLYLQQSSGVAI